MMFWEEAAFDVLDDLNIAIWAHSPEVQLEIHLPDQLAHPGAEGAQQAMLDGPLAGQVAGVLPWVPDLVGTQWREPQSLLIVGSAYAGFIEGYSGRQGCLRLVDYVHATNRGAGEFQRLFLREVITPDRSYYSLLRTLIEGQFAGPSHMALFDLCRASFVRRGERPPADQGRDSVTNKSLAYLPYVEHPTEQKWLWRRITGGEARRIIALGTIAEHGLLRLFTRQGMEVRATDSSVAWRPRPSEDETWPARYADPNRKLAHWRSTGNWWTIRGEIRGALHEWALLPIYHPGGRFGSANIRKEYQAVRPILQSMMEA